MPGLETTDLTTLSYIEAALDNPLSLLYDDILLDLLNLWLPILKKQRMLIDLPDSEILVIGDLHGDYAQTRRAFNFFDDTETKYIVFNGDIIDRGDDMMSALLLVIIRQIRDPEHVIYLRGNHEVESINAFYGFKELVLTNFSENLYEVFNQCFVELPLACKVGEWAFITHGGIPVEPIFFHLMRLELKPKEPLNSSYGGLLWNDPREEISTYAPSLRGEGIYYFGERVLDNFLKLHCLKMVVRSHEAYQNGYAWHFNGKMLTVFSSSVGPYKSIDPYFVLIKEGRLILIRAKEIRLD